MKSSFDGAPKILFLSDVHLGAFSDAKNQQLEQDLINLINFAEQQNYRIAVLGDLFDYWIEYPGHVPSLGKRLLDRFESFNQTTPSLYITGNHDNWTIGHFTDRGFDVEANYRLLTLAGRKVLLIHGDATGDSLQTLQRPLFHRLIRNSHFLKIYRTLLPPRAGVQVMKYFSKLSRLTGSEESDPKLLNNWSRKILAEQDIEYILCGHDHRPRKLDFNYGTYLNLGTFHFHNSLVTYNNGNFSLVKWNKDEHTLVPF